MFFLRAAADRAAGDLRRHRSARGARLVHPSHDAPPALRVGRPIGQQKPHRPTGQAALSWTWVRTGRQRAASLAPTRILFSPRQLRQSTLAGRKGEVWGAESAADKLFMIRSE